MTLSNILYFCIFALDVRGAWMGRKSFMTGSNRYKGENVRQLHSQHL